MRVAISPSFNPLKVASLLFWCIRIECLLCLTSWKRAWQCFPFSPRRPGFCFPFHLSVSVCFDFLLQLRRRWAKMGYWSGQSRNVFQLHWGLFLSRPPRFANVPSFSTYLWHWDVWCPAPPNHLYLFICTAKPLKTLGLCLLSAFAPPCSFPLVYTEIHAEFLLYFHGLEKQTDGRIHTTGPLKMGATIQVDTKWEKPN